MLSHLKADVVGAVVYGLLTIMLPILVQNMIKMSQNKEVFTSLPESGRGFAQSKWVMLCRVSLVSVFNT